MYTIFDTVLIQVFEQFEKRNVNMSRKYDSILLFALFFKIILCTIDFVAELRTNVLTKLYQKKYVTSKEHFLSKPIQKEIWNKKYVVFFLFWEKVCIIRQNAKSSHLQIHVSLQQPICLQ